MEPRIDGTGQAKEFVPPRFIAPRAGGRSSNADGDLALLRAPRGVDGQTRAIWIPATLEVMWRVSEDAPSPCELEGAVNQERFGDAPCL